jgi:hypothetical protein
VPPIYHILRCFIRINITKELHSFIHSCLGDVVYNRYMKQQKSNDKFLGFFSLESCYTLWPVGIDKSWPIRKSSQLEML